ncbi:MFS transporter [Epilithonimonas sp. JDS]|uniref:MFS transporter n=1 Tax=Epilithonimonas sp. JDS TaxID=2902797 RepID=UPI001E64A1F6|nr:MFS transporter [Epilithonimonas sp. JDS]
MNWKTDKKASAISMGSISSSVIILDIDHKADKKSRRFRNIQLTIFLSGLSVFAQLYLFQPLLPTVAKDFKTSIGDSSWLVSSSTLGMALGLFFFAFKSDSFSRKKQMLFALLASSCLTIASAWIESLPLLIAMGVVKGFVIAGVSAVALAYITEEVQASVIGLAISMYLNGNTIGGMSGRMIATVLDGEIGWRNTVLIIGMGSLILALIFWKYFPDSRFHQPQKIDFTLKVKQMKNFASDSYMLRLYFVAFLIMGTFVSIYNYLTFRLESPPFSMNHLFIAFIFLMYTLGVVGTTIVGRLSERMEQRRILQVCIVLMLVGVLLLLSPRLFIVMIGLALLTLSFFGAHTMASKMVALHAQEAKSTATSLYWLFYYFGSALLGSGSGYFLHATSWSYFILLLGIVVLISYFLSLRKMKVI